MTYELILVLGLLGAAVIMFSIGKPRLDAVALIVIVLLPFTGVVTMGEALAGFSDPSIVLIAALFVLGDGLVRTGVTHSVGDWLERTAGKSEARLIVLLMVAVALIGSVMSSTAVTAIFIPILLRISQRTGINPGQLMMPLSCAALISGMITLVATAPNLVVDAELERHGLPGFSFFSFTPFGLPILALGIVYMLIARRWLPRKRATQRGGRANFTDWIKEYALEGRERRLLVNLNSPISGKSLGELNLRGTEGMNIVAVERRRGLAVELLRPTATTRLRSGDIILADVSVSSARFEAIEAQLAITELPLSGGYFSDRAQEIGMVEAIVPPNSELVGKTLVEAEFRTRFGLSAIGLRRGKTPMTAGFLDEKLKIGDTLLLIGRWKDIDRARAEPRDFVVISLPSEADDKLAAPGRAGYAIACLLFVVLLMAGGLLPNVQAALIGCLLMGLFGCIDFASAYRSIDWRTIILIAGMVPFAMALDRTGGIAMAAQGLATITDGFGRPGALLTLFAATAMLGMFISNTATAVLMAPVAIGLARDLGASPHQFAMVVALAASTAFMTPVSSPVNMLVASPGNYSFGDFLRIGVPFSMIVMVASTALVMWLMP